ncbi:10929_t:CDS:2, partial [Acaulospora colombiana]
MSREHHDDSQPENNEPSRISNSGTDQALDPRRTSISSVKSGDSGAGLRSPEGQPSSTTARVSLPNAPNPHARSRPSSSNGSARGNSPPPRLTRRKSSFIVSGESSEDPDEDTDDSKKRIRKKKHRSHRSRKHSITPSGSMVDNEGASHRSSHRDEENNDQDDIEFSGSDHEFTLKDRQETINTTHPFGLPLWKPALYKKSRSVIRDANSAIHSMPSPELYLYPGNILWAIIFGWWLALVSYILSIFLLLTPSGGWQYSRVLRELSYYIFWPFGRYVERMDEDWEEEDEERGDIYAGDSEFQIDEDHPLLGRRTSYGDFLRMKRNNQSLLIFFTLSVLSVIPISYFIGMAVASISAQSSIGLGAVINATFGSIVEIILYALALMEGRGKLTEGSIIGSLMAGVLLMPGLSMISGGMKRKEQKFNAKSAGVTSTMLIMAIIGAFTPTLFYETYAPSYLIGLWFTLRTHASLVWQTPHPHSEHELNRNHSNFTPKNILQQLLPNSQNALHATSTNSADQHPVTPIITIPTAVNDNLTNDEQNLHIT